jgi:RHS repeat-associated protein
VVTRTRFAHRSCMLGGSLVILLVALTASSAPATGAVKSGHHRGDVGYKAPSHQQARSVDFNVLTTLLGSASKTLRPNRAGRAASVVTGSMTIGGSPFVLTISTAGDTAAITFSGTVGQRISLNVYSDSIGAADVAIQNPSYPNAPQYLIPAAFVLGSQGKFFDPVTLGQSGTYTITVSPYSSGTGSMTLALYDVAADPSGPITPGGSPVVAQTTVPGQNAVYSFTATEGQRVSLRASTGTFTSPSGQCCGTYVRIVKVGQGQIASSSLIIPNSFDFIDTKTLSAGDYQVVVDPQGDAYGTTTVTLYDVPPDLTSPRLFVNGQAETITLGTPGQNALLPFHGDDGQTVTLTWSQPTIPQTEYKILDPSLNQLAASSIVETGSGHIDATLPHITSDSYGILVNPFADFTGSVTVRVTAPLPPVPLAQTRGVCTARGFNARVGSACLMDPVNSLTGAFTTAENDFTLASKGLPFTFTRSYTSADPTSGRLGTGWTDNYAVSLAIQPNGDAILHGDEGQLVTYTKQPDGSFVGAAGALSTLTAIAGGYKLVRTDQVTYTFSSAGVLQSEQDRNGQGLSFTYDGSGRLATAVDASGHTITFGYNGASTLLASVSSTAQNTVSYGYTGSQLTSITLPDPDGPGPLAQPVTHYTYDGGGRLATIVDPNNHTQVTNVYDPSTGRVTQQTDANNKTTNFSWDPATQTATATDANNHVWKDVYQDNVLIKRIDANNKTTLFEHNTSLDVTKVTSPDGTSATAMTYDTAGNVLTATAPASLGSVQKVFTYDAQNNVKTVTDARGKQTVYGYDAAGNLTSVTLDGQAVASATYNAQGQMLTSTDGNGKTTTYTYDTSGNVASVTAPDPDGAGPLAAAKTTYTYDAMGNVLTKVDPLGNCGGCTPANYTTTYTYDAEGHLLTETDPLGNVTKHTYDLSGNETSVEDANHHITTNEYDNANHLTKITAPDPDGAGALTSPITTYTYDNVGNRITEVNPRGNVSGGNPTAFTTTYAYDVNNRLVSVTMPKGGKTTYTYDANGNRDSVVEPRGNVQGANPNDFKTSYAYDAAGRLLTTTDPLQHVTTNHYDAVGNLDWTKDANNHQTSYSYDAAGRILTVTAPDGGLTTYTYDGNGNLKTRKDDNNHVTTYVYDDAGRLTQITGQDPDGAGAGTAPVTTYTYDVNGNRLTMIDPNGNSTPTAGDGKTTYTYDRDNRLKTIAYSDTTPGVTFNYDAVGNRSSMVDGSGTLTYTYDNLDRLKTLVRGTNTFSYTYDPAGNVLTRTYPDTTQITYTYDEDNRLATAASGGNTTGYAYDTAGNLTTTTLPSGNGYVETRAYDNAGRLNEVKNAKGASVLSDFVSTLDPVGNPTSVVQTGAVSSTTTYAYDANDRLTSVCFQAGTCPGASDPFIRWTYDKVGNRLTEARPSGASTTYTYNGLDELTQAGTTAYTYDQNGNEKSAGSRTFTYDLANRLKTTATAGTTTTYTYDGDGTRLQASTGTAASAKTNYLWDTNRDLPRLALERDGNNALLRRYVYGQRRIAMRSGTSDYYYNYDGLGSVRNVTSSTGATQWTDTYEPFGAIRTETKNVGTAPSNFMKFAGEYVDPTALYHLRARQYDSISGRFTAIDPVEQSLTEPLGSTYAYTSNHPTVMIDPLGTTFQPASDGPNAAQLVTSPATGVFSSAPSDLSEKCTADSSRTLASARQTQLCGTSHWEATAGAGSQHGELEVRLVFKFFAPITQYRVDAIVGRGGTSRPIHQSGILKSRLISWLPWPKIPGGLDLTVKEKWYYFPGYGIPSVVYHIRALLFSGDICENHLFG